MQQVDTWDLVDIVPITVPGSVIPSNPLAVQLQAGPNGWSYDLFAAGIADPIDESAALYGERTSQFQELQ